MAINWQERLYALKNVCLSQGLNPVMITPGNFAIEPSLFIGIVDEDGIDLILPVKGAETWDGAVQKFWEINNLDNAVIVSPNTTSVRAFFKFDQETCRFKNVPDPLTPQIEPVRDNAPQARL